MASSELFGAASDERRGSGSAVVAHCDGGARGNPGPAGYGALIADEQGNTLAELSEFLGNRTNNYAEYSGLLGVLAWALEHGQRRLRVVSDSELMVKQIQGRYKVNSPDLRTLFEEARRRIAKLESFDITHALRHKNKDADRLANDAMDRGMGRSTGPDRGGSTPGVSAAIPERNLTGTRAQTDAPRASPAGARPSTTADPAVSAPNGQNTGANRSAMLRGFVRGGTIHLLGGKTLPEGSFVKVMPE